MDKSKARHDFINNGLRLEVLNKMLTEQIEQSQELNSDYINDLETFLKLHLELVEKIKELY